MHTFKPTDTLIDVNKHILMTQEGPNQPFLLMTNFPKKVFSSTDMRKSLKELGNQNMVQPDIHLTISSCRFGAISCSDSNKTIILSN